jgi:hypothetical protein
MPSAILFTLFLKKSLIPIASTPQAVSLCEMRITISELVTAMVVRVNRFAVFVHAVKPGFLYERLRSVSLILDKINVSVIEA